jgi:hypothetical protein
MSNESDYKIPVDPTPTRTPSNKKDLALQSCIRLLFFLHASMKAQGAEKSMLFVSVHACLQLCGQALPDKFKLSEQETLNIIKSARASAEAAQAVSPAPAPVQGLPTAGRPMILRPDQIKKPT